MGPSGRDQVSTAGDRAARRPGQHGAGRGAHAGPLAPRSRRPPSGSSRGRPHHLPRLWTAPGRAYRRAGPGGDGAGTGQTRHGRQRHSPRRTRPRDHLQRVGRGGRLRGRQRSPRDLSLDRRGLLSGLRALGAPVEMVSVQPSDPGAMPAFCFARTGSFELEIDGRKLVGSAQRRQGTAFLQHGAIMLGAAPARLRRVFPGEGDPLAGMTTLESALGRRPSFDESRRRPRRGIPARARARPRAGRPLRGGGGPRRHAGAGQVRDG